MGGLLEQAQKMAEQMQASQAEMADTEFEGVAGGGVVRVTLTGDYECLDVSIDPAAVDPADVGMLEDLVKAALLDATSKVGHEGRWRTRPRRTSTWAACSAACSVATRPTRSDDDARPAAIDTTAVDDDRGRRSLGGHLSRSGPGADRRARQAARHRTQVGSASRLPSGAAPHRGRAETGPRHRDGRRRPSPPAIAAST